MPFKKEPKEEEAQNWLFDQKTRHLWDRRKGVFRLFMESTSNGFSLSLYHTHKQTHKVVS